MKLACLDRVRSFGIHENFQFTESGSKMGRWCRSSSRVDPTTAD